MAGFPEFESLVTDRAGTGLCQKAEPCSDVFVKVCSLFKDMFIGIARLLYVNQDRTHNVQLSIVFRYTNVSFLDVT